MSKLRRTLYKSASVLGDVEAAAGGPHRLSRRMVRKTMWRTFGRMMRQLTKAVNG